MSRPVALTHGGTHAPAAPRPLPPDIERLAGELTTAADRALRLATMMGNHTVFAMTAASVTQGMAKDSSMGLAARLGGTVARLVAAAAMATEASQRLRSGGVTQTIRIERAVVVSGAGGTVGEVVQGV